MDSVFRELVCTKCAFRTEPIEKCKCVCPYCGETTDCECVIGWDKATGGG